MATFKALVCDDEAPLRDLMARRLEKLGLEVERAEDGKDAIAHLERNHYDLLVTDIYMPDVTGLELLQRMKALDPHAQVVVVTASATLDNAVLALNHGAFAYLTKPFDHLSVFDNVVSRAVDFRRALLGNLRLAEVPRPRRGRLGAAGGEGHARGEGGAGGRRLEVSLSDLALPGDQHQQVLMLREEEGGAPAMGSLVQETLLNLRRGLTFMARRAQDPSSRKIIKGMAVEVSSLARL